LIWKEKKQRLSLVLVNVPPEREKIPLMSISESPPVNVPPD